MATTIETKTFLDEEGLNAYHSGNMQKIADEIESHNSSSTAHEDMRSEISEIKNIAHEHENKTELDKIVDGNVDRWNASLTASDLEEVTMQIDELSTKVAYIDVNDNVNVSDGVINSSGTNSNIVIDSQLSTTSNNPVRNKVITAKINELEARTLPIVTNNDNGCIMQVVDGAWSMIKIVDGNTIVYYPDGQEE